jgi:uncharacterized protein YigA (DUF484 family)
MSEQQDPRTREIYDRAIDRIPQLEEEITDFVENLQLNVGETDKIFKLIGELISQEKIKAMVESYERGLKKAKHESEADLEEKQRQDLILKQNMLSFRHNRNFKI